MGWWRRPYGVLGSAALAAWASVSAAEPTSVSPEAAIRAALSEWALAFNAGDTGAVCGLFAPELRYDYRGFPERGFEEVCGQLHASLADPTRKYAYDLTIKEIMVSGDLAAVRLVWTLTVRRPGEIGGTASHEPGLDLFRRQPDGSWKIVRYLAYEE
ncbi:MAG TPA: nuclear transport factor 2 family protein [Hyphomicrobiaceae bacterium]|nr:nuclear transport factor 2 family protein [Hyphomicrobiaceae bacterium]